MEADLRILLAGLALTLAACDDGSPFRPGDTVPASDPPYPIVYQPCDEDAGLPGDPAALAALPGGIWHGIVRHEQPRTTLGSTALVTEDGRFWLGVDYDQFVGTLAITGNTFEGTGVAYSGGSGWKNGRLLTDLTISGTIVERGSISGRWNTASGDNGCFEYAYDRDAYEQPASLAKLAGTWEEKDGWGFTWSLTVDPDGSFVWHNPYFCDTIGRLALIDDRYSLYEVQDAFDVCATGGSAYTGLAYSYRDQVSSSAREVIVLRMHDGSDRMWLKYSRPARD